MKLLSTLILTLFVQAALGAPSIKKKVLKLSSSNPTTTSSSAVQQVYIQYAEAQDDELPVLLLGPGVNRGLISYDSFIKSIRQMGYGFVALHFSTLPHSVDTLKEGETPLFEKKSFSVADYAKEVELVAQWARDQFNKDIVPISLSFSGAPSALLKSFKTVIDIAPMTSLSDARPQLGFYLSTLRAANMFNPFGRAVIRAAMDQSYSLVWRPKTESMIESFGFNEDRSDSILEGYMTSSRALEDFKWDIKETPESTTRIFILGEEEGESLLEGQARVVKEYFNKDRKVGCFFVRGAGHAVSLIKPSLTAEIIDSVIRNKKSLDKGCYDVHGSNDQEFIEAKNLDLIF